IDSAYSRMPSSWRAKVARSSGVSERRARAATWSTVSTVTRGMKGKPIGTAPRGASAGSGVPPIIGHVGMIESAARTGFRVERGTPLMALFGGVALVLGAVASLIHLDAWG